MRKAVPDEIPPFCSLDRGLILGQVGERKTGGGADELSRCRNEACHTAHRGMVGCYWQGTVTRKQKGSNIDLEVECNARRKDGE